MHRDVHKAIEQIDACIFSGDVGGPASIKHLKEYCERWLRELNSMQKCFEEVEPETVRLPLDKGCIDSALVCYEKDKRGKNWVATVEHDPKSPGALSRDFWKRGSASYVVVPKDLKEGDVLEFAAEYYTSIRNSNQNRRYMAVSAMDEESIYLTEVEKP